MVYYEEIVTNFDSQKMKLFNLETVGNLIYHLDNIEEKSKAFVYDELYNYLFFIKDIKLEGSSKELKHQSHELYSTFLSPLIKFYLPLGFRAIFPWLVFIFISVLCIPILLILNCSVYYYGGIFLFLLFLRLMSWLKERQRKVYGAVY